MRVRYRHIYTVVVEGDDSFNESATLQSIKDGGDRDARLNHILVKHGGIDPKPVRSSVVTTTHIEIAKSE